MDYIHALVRLATATVDQWGYPAIFVLMLLESACIPVPSEAIMVFAGFMVHQGRLDMLPAVLAGAVGNLAGSWLAYGAGYYGGRPLILRYGKYLLVHPKKVDAADRFFDCYGNGTGFFARLLPVIRTFISLPAGISRMGFTRFTGYTFAGCVPWSWLLAYVGLLVGANWEKALRRLDLVTYGLLAVVVVGLTAWWLIARRRAAEPAEGD